MNIEDEMKHLHEPLSHISLSALALARELEPEAVFERRQSAWICRPNNFVGFEIRYKRASKCNILLRAVHNIVGDDALKTLPWLNGPLGYIRVEIKSAKQLGAIHAWIMASHGCR
jgi:hypothetical protein